MTTPSADSISFSLTFRLSVDGLHVLVLRLYRGPVAVLTTTIATVEASKANAVLSQCRNHLERLGICPVTHLQRRTAPRLPAATSLALLVPTR